MESPNPLLSQLANYRLTFTLQKPAEGKIRETFWWLALLGNSKLQEGDPVGCFMKLHSIKESSLVKIIASFFMDISYLLQVTLCRLYKIAFPQIENVLCFLFALLNWNDQLNSFLLSHSYPQKPNRRLSFQQTKIIFKYSISKKNTTHFPKLYQIKEFAFLLHKKSDLIVQMCCGYAVDLK